MAGGAPKQKVLILGSGHVSGPVVEYLARDPERHLTIGKEKPISLFFLIIKFPHNGGVQKLRRLKSQTLG